MYQVIGDTGLDSERVLFESANSREAVLWAEKYTRRGLGEFSVVTVTHFDRTGEAHDHWLKRRGDK